MSTPKTVTLLVYACVMLPMTLFPPLIVGHLDGFTLSQYSFILPPLYSNGYWQVLHLIDIDTARLLPQFIFVSLLAVSILLGLWSELARLQSAIHGNFGDSEPVGEGISEMRIHVGAGYRVYYMRTGTTVYLLLAGGDKSTQRKDITHAKKIARELKEEKP